LVILPPRVLTPPMPSRYNGMKALPTGSDVIQCVPRSRILAKDKHLSIVIS
jgi:hypothetical protein